MNTKLTGRKRSAEHVKDIRRATRHHFSSEDKIRIVRDDLRGEDGIAELCRKEGIAQSLHTWSKEFLRTLLSLGGIVADQKWRLP
jgi:transposase